MKDNYVAVLLEDIQGKIIAMAEVMGLMVERLDGMDRRLIHIEEQFMPQTQLLLKYQSHELDNHNSRITKLETA